MSIEKKFEDFSDWPEHLKPVKLDKIAFGESSATEVIYAVLEQKGGSMTTAAVQNTLKAYGIEGATSVMVGEVEKTARIVQFLRENGIEYLDKIGATILIYNTVAKHIDDPDSFHLAEMICNDCGSVTPRDLYTALSVPEKRYLSRGIDRHKLPALCAALKSAPDTLGVGELQKKYALTKLSTPPSRRREPQYIEAPKCYD